MQTNMADSTRAPGSENELFDASLSDATRQIQDMSMDYTTPEPLDDDELEDSTSTKHPRQEEWERGEWEAGHGLDEILAMAKEDEAGEYDHSLHALSQEYEWLPCVASSRSHKPVSHLLKSQYI